MDKTPEKTKLATPSARLRLLRAMSGLTRPAIAAKYRLPEITLKKWETGCSITKKGVQKCIEFYKKEGVIVTEAWIQEGVGQFPVLTTYATSDVHGDGEEDLDYFKKKYPSCLMYTLDHEDMVPHYKPNDVVIGFQHHGPISDLHLKDCIVLLDQNELVFRKLIVAAEATFNLAATNPQIAVNPIIFDAKIQIIAPVAWHRISVPVQKTPSGATM